MEDDAILNFAQATINTVKVQISFIEIILFERYCHFISCITGKSDKIILSACITNFQQVRAQDGTKEAIVPAPKTKETPHAVVFT